MGAMFSGRPSAAGPRYVFSAAVTQWLEQGPLGIGQVTGIGFGSHPLSTSESVLWNRLSANLIAAQIRRSERYDYRVLRLDDQVCTIEIVMDGEAIGTSTFSVDDARRAGLDGGELEEIPAQYAVCAGDLQRGPLVLPRRFCGQPRLHA